MPNPSPEYDLRHLNFEGTPARRPRSTAAPRRASRLPPQIARHRPDAPAPEDAPADEFVAWLFAHAGFDVSLYRAAPLRRRLPSCLRALRCATPAAARAVLETGSQAQLDLALSSLLLGVTEFFRDPPVFAALRKLLPNLPGAAGGLRIWSASCSDGPEVYSIAILLAELDLLRGSRLLGTDCRPEAIARARGAVYPEAALRGLATHLRQRYLEPTGRDYRVSEQIRSHAQFDVQDLFRSGAPGPWDVVLWRNTAIYLRSEAAGAVWRRLAESLRPGGLLVAGKAERPDLAVPPRRVSGYVYAKATE